MIKTIEIKSRKNINLSIRLNVSEERFKTVFLLHGLASRNDYPHMLVLEDKFSKNGYNVINIDASDSLNKSGSSKDGVTFTGFINDLEDVINWAKEQPFYFEPFALSGQSLGAETVVYYASMNPSKVNLLIPLAFPWLNGEIESIKNKRVKDINEKGFYEQVSKSNNRVLIIKKNFIDDLKNYNLENTVGQITAKTYILVGDKDTEYHIDNNKRLYDLLTCEKSMYILKNVPHDMANEVEHKEKLESIISEILKDN